MSFRERLRSWVSAPSTTSETSDSPIIVTGDELVWFVGKQMLDSEPPFDRSEWHLALVEIPSDWEAIFEMLSHIHIHVVLLEIIEAKFGDARMSEVYRAIEAKWEDAFAPSDPGRFMVNGLRAIVNSEPMSEDDPLFQRPELDGFSKHGWSFGRARAALSLVSLAERHRPEAISGLGRCFVYSRTCATTRFGGMVRRLEFRSEDA